MKDTKKDILIIVVAFILSLTTVTFASVEIVERFSPQFNHENNKEAIKKANITKWDLAFEAFGKEIPEDKVDTYNSFVNEQYKIDYSKKDVSSMMEGIWIILFCSIVVTTVLTAPYFYIKAKLKRRKQIKVDKVLKKNYGEKYSLNGKNFYVKCIESSYYNKEMMDKTLIVWQENELLYFVNQNYKNDIGLIGINIKDITCFSRYGDLYTSLNINGGDSSYGRATLGYLFAGPAGAIIASRNSISSTTQVHDNRETLLFINEGDNEKFIFFAPEFYDFLMHIMPNKEVNHMLNTESKSKESNKLDELSKLAELKEKGIINESEFTKLKNELIYN